MKTHTHIPRFFLRLFRWFCHPQLFEELQGDLEESFQQNLELWEADCCFCWYSEW